ncbi:MAG: hypothetical protein NZ934_01905 [Hadesarchaea archaeon]|nr:hypothetical protein [Hadesarchaea archaeon]
MKLIIASIRDPAAQNIAAQLLELFDFERQSSEPNVYVHGDVSLAMVEGEAIEITKLPIAAEEVIVASRHASGSRRPTLTVHVPGDLKSGQLAVASPATVKAALRALAAARDELAPKYEVSLEATHHGPTKLDEPVTFVEVGSSPVQWHDERAALAVAQAIMAATSPIEGRNAIGIGGPHYAPKHTEVTLHTDLCIGHILPSYINVDRELVEKAIAKTRGGIEAVALDWKGLSVEQRRRLQTIVAWLGLQTV